MIHKFVEYIDIHIAKNPSFFEAKRLLDCISHIKTDLQKKEKSEILGMSGQTKILRYEGMAFHLDFYSSRELAEQSLNIMVEQVEFCLAGLLNIADTNTKNAIINIFLFKMGDSGCMEARIGPAIAFWTYYQEKGLLTLNDLMSNLASQLTHPVETSIEPIDVLHFFGDYIENSFPILNKNNEIRVLTWQDIKEYCEENLCWEQEDWIKLKDQIETPFCILQHQTNHHIWHIYYFNQERAAKEQLAFVRLMMSAALQRELNKAQIKNKQGQYSFRLTDKQYQTLQINCLKKLNIDQNQQLSKKDITNLTPTERQDLRLYYREIAKKKELNKIFALKSLRGDQKNYFLDFLNGILPPYEKSDLRWGPHKRFAVTGEGIIDRKFKRSQYTAEEKQGFSKAQAVTVGSPDFHPNIIFFSKHTQKNAGVLIEFEDTQGKKNVLPSNYLCTHDFGSTWRPGQFHTYEEAKLTAQKVLGGDGLPRTLFSAKEFDDFLEAIKSPTHLTDYNEALLRLKWKDDGSCYFFNYVDNLESRLLVQIYAKLWQKALREKNLGGEQPIPIYYYMPESPLHLKEYSKEEQVIDQFEARTTYLDKEKLIHAYQKNNYEVLFFISKEEVIQALQEKLKNGKTILSHMILSGYSAMIDMLVSYYDLDRIFINDLIVQSITTNTQETAQIIYYFIEHRNEKAIRQFWEIPAIKNDPEIFNITFKDDHHINEIDLLTKTIECDMGKTLALFLTQKITQSRIDYALNIAAIKNKPECTKVLLPFVELTFAMDMFYRALSCFWSDEYNTNSNIKMFLNDPRIQKNINYQTLTIPHCIQTLLTHVYLDMKDPIFNLTKETNKNIKMDKIAELLRELLSCPGIDVNLVPRTLSLVNMVEPFFDMSKSFLDFAVSKRMFPLVAVFIEDGRAKVRDIAIKSWEKLFDEHRSYLHIQAFSQKWLKEYLDYRDKTGNYSSPSFFSGLSGNNKIAAAEFLYANLANLPAMIASNKMQPYAAALNQGSLGDFFKLISKYTQAWSLDNRMLAQGQHFLSWKTK